MPRTIPPFLVVLGLQLGGCGGDDTVNPSNPEAGLSPGTKDAAAGDAKTTRDGSAGAGEGGSNAVVGDGERDAAGE